MDTYKFVKTFNKGQITIPKEIRDFLGLAGEFWLKMYTVNGKIVAEPVDKKIDRQQYLKDLLSIKGGWLDEKEIIRNRKQIEERLKKNSL